jgi:hypothetical protein
MVFSHTLNPGIRFNCHCLNPFVDVKDIGLERDNGQQLESISEEDDSE